MKECNKASISLTSQEYEILEELAYDYFMFGVYEVAKTIYEGLVEAAPQVATYQVGLGLSYKRLGLSGAEDMFHSATQSDPTDALPWIHLAELPERMGSHQQRLDFLHIALNKLHPSDRLYSKVMALLRSTSKRESQSG
ncbi:MAG: hypothetical protein KTR25_08935 [Myxococcales bacterium]|nr:hypothetical protein [Myxococcales bacterium]